MTVHDLRHMRQEWLDISGIYDTTWGNIKRNMRAPVALLLKGDRWKKKHVNQHGKCEQRGQCSLATHDLKQYRKILDIQCETNSFLLSLLAPPEKMLSIQFKAGMAGAILNP